MQTKFFVIFLLLLNSCLLYGYTIKYIEETLETTEIEITLEDIFFIEREDFTEVDFNKASRFSESGKPDIPFIKLFFSVPPNGYLQAQIQENIIKHKSLFSPIKPIGSASKLYQLIEEYTIDQNKYRQSNPQIEILPKETFNQYDLIPVIIYIVNYDYEKNRISYSEKVRLRVEISGDFPSTVSKTINNNPLYSALITNNKYGSSFTIQRSKDFNTSQFNRSHSWYRIEVVKDGFYVLDYQFLSRIPINDIDPRTIRIFSTGGMLMNMGVDDPGHPFEEIPLHIITTDETSFNNGDKIYFYAQQRDGFGRNIPMGNYHVPYNNNLNDYHYNNPYTKTGLYWLTWGGHFLEAPKRIHFDTDIVALETRTSGRVFTHFENLNANIRNDEYNIDWYTMILQSGTQYRFNEVLEDLDTTIQQKFDIVLSSRTSNTVNTFNISVRANNNNILTNSWNHGNPIRFTQSGRFFQENNDLSIVASGTSLDKLLKFYHIEWYKTLRKKMNKALVFHGTTGDINKSIEYRFVNEYQQTVNIYKVSTIGNVTMMRNNNNSFATSTNSNTQFFILAEADYERPLSITHSQPQVLDNVITQHDIMIISPVEFITGATRLQTIYHDKQGYNAIIVSLEDVYNNFSGGHPDPFAIRNYLQFIQMNSPDPKPLGAVFIGTGTIDARNYSGMSADKNKFLVNLRDLNNSQIQNIKISDDFYANITRSDNAYPEIIVGRIPVKTMTEFNTYLDKLDEYLRNPFPGWWQYTAQLIADDQYSGHLQDEEEHTKQIESFGKRIEKNILVDKIFAVEYELGPDKKKPQVKNLLVDKINEGRLYWVYQGHGSERNNGDENYFNASFDIPLLRNKGKYPIYIAGSCDVGQYQSINLRTLAEELLILRNAGAIISIASTGKSLSGPNSTLFGSYLDYAINEGYLPGQALLLAKRFGGAGVNNNCFYNILGDPFLKVAMPIISNNLVFSPETDTLDIGQTVLAQGNFDTNISADYVHNLVFDSGYSKPIRIRTLFYITNDNLPVFNGKSKINNSNYNLGFVIPIDTQTGNNSRIFSLAIDKSTNKVYVNKKTNFIIKESDFFAPDSLKPEIELFIDNENFKEGDTVSPFPTLIARLSSEKGLNSIGSPGHNMMIIPNNSNEIIFATKGFEYDLDSYTTGTLTWRLNNLPTGRNDIKLVVFDSFNEMATADTWFITSSIVDIKIKDALVYPNPMKRNGGDFTFNLSHEATISFSIYTITGRKIYSKNNITAKKGFNYGILNWNGRDADGQKIANGTYFYKIKATAKEGKGTTEITEKFIMLN